MKIFIASYDLSSPGGDYSGVENALATCAIGQMLHVQKSVWLLASRLSAKQIRDEVSDSLRNGDTVFVARLDSMDWAGWGTKAQAWISEKRSVPE